MNATVVMKNSAIRIISATNILNHKNYHVYMCISLKIHSDFFEKPISAKTLSGVRDSKSRKFEFSETSKCTFMEGLESLNIVRGNCLKIIDDCQNALSLAL
jgi:hypothetical protein